MFTIFLRTKDYKLYTAAILLWVYASFIRPELVVILPFALLAIFLNKNDTTIIFKNEKNIALSLLAAFFILFDFFISYISNKFYYSNFIAFYNIPGLYSIKFFITNLKNIIFYTQYSKNYIYILSPIIIAFGFWMLVKKHLPAALVVIGTVLGIFAIHTSYYFGSYAIMGDLHSRFPMMWFSISAIFFGVGLNWIIQKLKYPLGIYILLLIIGSVCLWKFSGTTFFPSPATQPLSESKALDNFQLLNPTCLYISPLGFRDISNGYDAMDIQDFISQEYAAQVNQRSCVIFFDSYMCNWQNPDDACRLLITNFASEQILTQPRAWQLLTPNMKLAKTNFNPINPAPTLQQLIFYPHKNNPNDIR